MAYHIPISISNTGQLLSLDLSSNRLWGPIPVSLSSLSFLRYVNLCNNGFSGMIPYTGHITTFGESSFAGNPGLCGAPLAVKCPGDDELNKGPVVNENHDDGNFIDKLVLFECWVGVCCRTSSSLCHVCHEKTLERCLLSIYGQFCRKNIMVWYI